MKEESPTANVIGAFSTHKTLLLEETRHRRVRKD